MERLAKMLYHAGPCSGWNVHLAEGTPSNLANLSWSGSYGPMSRDAAHAFIADRNAVLIDRFAERRFAIRAAAEAVAATIDRDTYIIIRDLADRGNGTFGVTVMAERDEPLAPEDCEPPDSLGEGGDDAEYEGVASLVVPFDDDLTTIEERLTAQIGATA